MKGFLNLSLNLLNIREKMKGIDSRRRHGRRGRCCWSDGRPPYRSLIVTLTAIVVERKSQRSLAARRLAGCVRVTSPRYGSIWCGSKLPIHGCDWLYACGAGACVYFLRFSLFRFLFDHLHAVHAFRRGTVPGETAASPTTRAAACGYVDDEVPAVPGRLPGRGAPACTFLGLRLCGRRVRGQPASTATPS